MLSALTRGFRFKVAIALAAFAALCFVLPPAVLAFGHGAHAVECLAHADMVNHGMSKADGIAHHGDHSLPSVAHQPGSGCCGLFCMSALPADLDQGLGGVMAGQTLALPAPSNPLSQVPEQPDPPPISLAVL
jgi:hypothetical protein